MAGTAFNDPKRLIARGKQHIDELERKVKAFSDSKPYARVIERDPQGVNELHKIKLTRQFPEEFETIAFDACSNLRAALDQAAYVSAIAGGHTNPKRTAFPIADDAMKLEIDVIGRGNCKDIPPDILKLFRAFKPYKGGNNLVWALNRLANTNKHKLIVPIGHAVANMTIRNLTLRAGGSNAALKVPTWDNEKGEMVFGVIGPGGEFQYDFDLTIFVAFGPMDIVGGQPAIAVLGAMAGEVERIVLATEAECRRLGLIV